MPKAFLPGRAGPSLERPMRSASEHDKVEGFPVHFALNLVLVSSESRSKVLLAMARSTSKDAQALLHSFRSAYAATPTNLKIIDLYVGFAVFTALIQIAYIAIVGSFPFNAFLSGLLSCIGTAVLAVCLRIQVNRENKEFKDLPPERAFADFVLCNLVLHLVIMNFLG